MINTRHFENEALEIEETEEVQHPEEQQDDVEHDRQDSVPLLFAAIQAGNLEGVRNLLDQTTEYINSSSYGGLTPMHAACHMQQLDILKLLISRGAKIGAFDSLGSTALHIAVTEKWYDGVRELLQQGASPNKLSQPPTTVNGILRETPFHTAVRLGDKTSTTMMMKYYPDFSLRDSKNSSVYHLAACNKSLAIMKQLLLERESSKHLKELEKDGDGIFHAALSGDISVQNESQVLKVIQQVHKSCDNVNQVNLLGETPLFRACQAGLPNVVKFFLANGADPTQVTRERQSTLHAASKSGCPTTLRHLLSTGRVGHLITNTDNEGNHPFFFAVQSASVDCCKILLDNGEHLTRLGKDGVSNCSLILEKLPSAMQLFRKLFDSGVKLSKKPQHDPDFSITFDYSVLMNSEKEKMQSSIVSELAGTPLESLIKHPLLESFLYIKWCRIRKIFYFNFFEFLCYLILHTVFVMLTFGRLHVDWTEHPSGLFAFRFFHGIFLLIIFIPGVIVTFANYKKYLLQWETYTRFIAIVSSAIVIFIVSGHRIEEPPITDTIVGNITANESLTTDAIVGNIIANESLITDANMTDVVPKPELSIDRALASVSVFFGWVELMMLLGRFPALGAYILMFTRVGKSVIKFLLSFLCLILGFSFSFHILFLKLPVFADYKLSFVKTLMMMTGEIAYSEFVLDKDVPLPAFSLVVMSMFLFMVTVIMSNLLIGLAVNDLPDLKRQGKIKRLVKQASYLMAYEKLILFAYNMKIFPGKLRTLLSARCNIKSVITILPNKELKRNRYRQTIPDETIREAITLGSCENPEDFPTAVEEDINNQLKAFHIRYSSDRRTQKHKFANISDMCNDITKQMDQLQYKIDNQLAHVSMQLQQQLQQNQKLYNHLLQIQPDIATIQKENK